MKYVSIDVETTGLKSAEHQMVEFGAVLEDTAKIVHVDQLPSFRAIILQKDSNYKISPLVMRMHSKLFEEMDLADSEKLRTSEFQLMPESNSLHTAYYCYSARLEDLFNTWLMNVNGYSKKGKIIPAGKNFYGFDYTFIELTMSSTQFHHRHLDPVAYFTRATDQEPPKLELCCERAGIVLKEHHTAVGDAKTVIELIRIGMSRCLAVR